MCVLQTAWFSWLICLYMGDFIFLKELVPFCKKKNVEFVFILKITFISESKVLHFKSFLKLGEKS